MTGPSRRRFLTTAGAAGLLLSNRAAAESIGGAEIATVEDAERGTQLNLFMYEGCDSPTVLDPFARQYGSQIRFQMVSGDADAFNKIRSGQADIFDLVNLNNPWANIFYDAGYLLPLDEETFGPYYDNMISRFQRPYKWAHSCNDGKLLGMVQRFGPMSFVAFAPPAQLESSSCKLTQQSPSL